MEIGRGLLAINLGNIMGSTNQNEREQAFAEYFNLIKRKKEFASVSDIKKPEAPRSIFQRYRELMKGESEDIQAVADYIADSGSMAKRYNIGYNIGNGYYAQDGGDKEEAAPAAEKKAEKTADAAKNKAAEAIKKKFIKRAAVRTGLQAVNVVFSSLSTVLGIFVFIFFIIITAILWLFGIA